MIDYSDYPPELAYLLREIVSLIDHLVDRLKVGLLSAVQFGKEMTDLISRYSIAGYMTGARSGNLSSKDLENIKGYVKAQVGFLEGFVAVIQDSDTFMEGWRTRAESYARGIVAPYWKGKTKVLPLPVMPTESCQCGNNCACAWNISVIDEEKGDYDAVWTLNATRIIKTVHCQDCLERSEQWNPLLIRGGSLVIPQGFLAKEFQNEIEKELENATRKT